MLSISKSPNSIDTEMSKVVFLPDDLIVEILSYLPVKPLVRSKSVCKSWNSLISDPKFGKLRLQRSTRNSHIAVIKHGTGYPNAFVTFPLNHLLENPSITISGDGLKFNEPSRIIGSCNGLLCLVDHTTMSTVLKSQFRIWNPTTRIISEKFGSFNRPPNCSLNCTFGYDNSTGTYKVVVLFRNEVQIFSLGDNRRKSLSFPPSDFGFSHVTKGVYLSGTINWFAIRSKFSHDYCLKDITFEQFVIISLDLGTETYKQFQTPRGVDEVADVKLSTVLMDCLCFSYNLKNTHFVIWQMTEFGVEQSWTQFLKISFQNLLVDDRFYFKYFMFPLWLSKNGDTLLLANSKKDQAFLYNLRDNRVERTGVDGIAWKKAICYVQSKASIC